MDYQIESLLIKSQGDELAADFYRPRGKRKPPVVIMANGFAGERRFGLPRIARDFAEHGYAVVLFDYRGFGGSTGKPREWVNEARHQEDWQAVLDHVRGRKDIDPKRIALWGVSFSGGHVLHTAASNPKSGISGLIALVPHVDGRASLALYPKRWLPSALALGSRDAVGAKLGRDPIRVPVVAPDGLRCLAGEDSYDGYRALVPEGSSWRGEVPAQILVQMGVSRPTTVASKVPVPSLVIGATQDSLVPIAATRKAAKKLKKGIYREYDMGHFDMYGDAFYPQLMTEQLNFLSRIFK